MELFRGRCLAVYCICFIVTAYASAYIGGGVKIAVFVISIALLIFFAFVFDKFLHKPTIKNKKLNILIALIFICIALVQSYIFIDIRYESVKKYADKDNISEVEMIITKKTASTVYSGTYEVTITNIEGNDCNIKAKMTCDSGDFESNEIVAGEGYFVNLSRDINGYAEETHSLSRGIMTIIEMESAELVGKVSHNLITMAQSLNERFTGIILAVTNSNQDIGGVIAALLLGNKSALPDQVERDFRRLGISHLLAISGMHLVFIVGNVDRVLSQIKFIKILRFKRIRNIFLLLTVLGYMALTGFIMSVVRASVMLILAYIADFIRRENDSLTSLFTAVALIIFWDYSAAFDVGLQLSFLATLAIILGNSSFKQLKIVRIFKDKNGGIIFIYIKKLILWIFSSIFSALFITVFTLPVMWAVFGEMSIISLLANLIFIPLMDILLNISPLILIFWKVPFICEPVSALASLIVKIIIGLASWISPTPGIVLSLRYAAAPVMILFFVTGIILFMVLKERRNLYFAVLTITGALLFSFGAGVQYIFTYNRVDAYMHNYSKSDCITVISRNKAAIIDISDGSYSALLQPINKLKDECISEIDMFMLTHYHKKHVSSIDKLTDRQTVYTIALPEPANESDKFICDSILELAESKNIDTLIFPRNGKDSVHFNDAYITLFPYSKISRSTHPVISLTINSDYANVTYIGSSVHESDIYDLIARQAKISDVLVFGIHGPIYKTPADYQTDGNLDGILYPVSDVREFTQSDETAQENAVVVDGYEYFKIKLN